MSLFSKRDRNAEPNEILIPHYHYKRIDEITPEDIFSWGVKGVAIDIDNTICYDSTAIYIGRAKEWVESMRGKIPLMIVSNANASRAMYIAKKLNIPCIPMAKKPNIKPYNKAAKILGLDIGEIAFIGDQIFSDVKGANCAGAVSVYVEPPAKEIIFYFFYKYRRFKEKPIIRKMLELERISALPHKVREKVNENG